MTSCAPRQAFKQLQFAAILTPFGGSMKKLWLAVSLLTAFLTSNGRSLLAQNTNSGDIRGVATDPTGAVIPDVTVTVVNIEKGISSEYKTNGDGLYDTRPIVTGTYKVTFEKSGFDKFIRSSVTLDVGTITISAEMKLGNVTEQVVVNTDVPLIKTETGEQSTT